MMTLYRFLDILGTMSELLIFYVVASCFHLMPEGKGRKILPYLIWLFGMYILTWFTGVGEYKAVVGTLAMALMMWGIYRIPFFRAAISSMFSMTVVILLESAGTIISSLLGVEMSVRVGELMFVSTEMYLIIFACKIAGALAIYLLFKNFQVEFTWKDFGIVLFNFTVVQSLFIFYYGSFFGGEEGYFNLALEIICLLLSVGMLLPFFYLENYYTLREKAKEDQLIIERLQTKYAYYQDKQREEREVRRVYHDLKNHLLILQAKTDTGPEVDSSVQTLQAQLSEYENYYHTGNDFLDIIIRDKARLAQEKLIDFHADIRFEDGAFIEPLDVSTLFGNALDNAIEAGGKLPEEERLITVKASRIRDMLIVTVENNVGPDEPEGGRTTKKDAFLHGFGLPNMKRAAEKYGGQCTARREGGRFVLKMVIPIPQ